jgi:hypothetical protein
MHPLAPDLSKLTDEELHSKHAELVNRMTFAYRMGQGQLVEQMQLLMADYANEVAVRNQRLLDNSGKNFADKINITK